MYYHTLTNIDDTLYNIYIYIRDGYGKGAYRRETVVKR